MSRGGTSLVRRLSARAAQAARPTLPLAHLPAFRLERYFAKYEFSAPYLLCASDTEALTLKEALEEYADDDARRQFDDLTLNYTEPRGHPALLEEIAAMYAEDDGATGLLSGAHVQEIAPQEGILLAMLALLEKGDRVVAAAPSYQSLFDVARAVGATVDYWTPTEDETSGHHFSVDSVADKIPGAKLVVVNFPHNPTGCLPTRREWAKLIQLCDAHGAWLFSDEMYRGLEGEEGDERRLAPAVAAYPTRGISLAGASKALGMPGVRLGWLASRDEAFLRRVAALRDWTTICSSAPSQILGLVAVRARRRLLARANAFVARGKTAVASVIDSRPDLFAPWGNNPHGAGPCGFVRILHSGDSGSRSSVATAYCEALAAESGILLLPGGVYGAGAEDDRHFRVGFGRRATPDVAARWAKTLDDADHPATRLLLSAAS